MQEVVVAERVTRLADQRWVVEVVTTGRHW
jgi:hypothetical protein